MRAVTRNVVLLLALPWSGSGRDRLSLSRFEAGGDGWWRVLCLPPFFPSKGGERVAAIEWRRSASCFPAAGGEEAVCGWVQYH